MARWKNENEDLSGYMLTVSAGRMLTIPCSKLQAQLFPLFNHGFLSWLMVCDWPGFILAHVCHTTSTPCIRRLGQPPTMDDINAHSWPLQESMLFVSERSSKSYWKSFKIMSRRCFLLHDINYDILSSRPSANRIPNLSLCEKLESKVFKVQVISSCSRHPTRNGTYILHWSNDSRSLHSTAQGFYQRSAGRRALLSHSWTIDHNRSSQSARRTPTQRSNFVTMGVLDRASLPSAHSRRNGVPVPGVVSRPATPSPMPRSSTPVDRASRTCRPCPDDFTHMPEHDRAALQPASSSRSPSPSRLLPHMRSSQIVESSCPTDSAATRRFSSGINFSGFDLNTASISDLNIAEHEVGSQDAALSRYCNIHVDGYQGLSSNAEETHHRASHREVLTLDTDSSEIQVQLRALVSGLVTSARDSLEIARERSTRKGDGNVYTGVGAGRCYRKWKRDRLENDSKQPGGACRSDHEIGCGWDIEGGKCKCLKLRWKRKLDKLLRKFRPSS